MLDEQGDMHAYPLSKTLPCDEPEVASICLCLRRHLGIDREGSTTLLESIVGQPDGYARVEVTNKMLANRPRGSDELTDGDPLPSASWGCRRIINFFPTLGRLSVVRPSPASGFLLGFYW